MQNYKKSQKTQIIKKKITKELNKMYKKLVNLI